MEGPCRVVQVEMERGGGSNSYTVLMVGVSKTVYSLLLACVSYIGLTCVPHTQSQCSSKASRHHCAVSLDLVVEHQACVDGAGRHLSPPPFLAMF